VSFQSDQDGSRRNLSKKLTRKSSLQMSQDVDNGAAKLGRFLFFGATLRGVTFQSD
jgi:hypothetical protein